MNIFGLGVVAFGYAFFYWSLNILVQAYKRTTTMNPPPLSVCLGIPGANAGNTSQPDTGLAGGPGPDVPGTTPPPGQPTPPPTSFDPLTGATP